VKDRMYDILIVGGGPAGLTAALYGARADYSVLVIEEMVAGGQIASTSMVENYPGFPDSVSGVELGQRLEQQARKFGAELRLATVTGVELKGSEKRLYAGEDAFQGKTVILAPGTTPNTLGIPGEEKLKGRGISFCATCDGPFFGDQVVAVIGGGDSAVEEALFLAKFAKKVVIVHRRDKLRAVKSLQEKALANPKVEVCWDSVGVEVLGEDQVEGLKVRNVKSGVEDVIDCSGIFLYVGRVPRTEFLQKSSINLDERGYIITDQRLMTNVAGVFAAGDARQTPLRQVVTAAADGALAATEAAKLLE